MKDLSIKAETIELLEESIEINLHEHGFGNCFLDTLQKLNNDKKRDFTKIKIFCTSEDAIKRVKRQLINERNYLQIVYLVSGWYLDYRKDSYNLMLKRQPFNKWTKVINRHFSTEVIQRASRHMKKCSV